MNKYYIVNINPINYSYGIARDRIENLKGEVAYLTQFVFNADAKSGAKGEFDSSTSNYSLKFNAVHQIIEEYGYRRPDIIASKTSFLNFRENKIARREFYNEDGDVLSFEEFRYNEHGIHIGTTNMRNNVIENIDFDVEQFNKGFILKTKFVDNYFEDNRLTQSFNKNNTLSHAYSYHNNGVLRIDQTSENNVVTFSDSFDEKGNIIKKEVFRYKKGVLNESSTYLYQYNENNLLEVRTEVFFIKQQTGIQRFIHSYNNMNQLTSITRERDGSSIELANYKYNEDGDLVYKIYDKEITKIDYPEYDNNRNWLQKVVFHKNKPFQYYERKIQYFVE